MKNMPLTKRFDANLRLYFNVGAVASQLTISGYMCSSASTNTFTNTCPILQSALLSTPNTAIGIVSSLSIAKCGSTNLFGGVNLANSGASHPMPNCRAYYPMIELKPEIMSHYLSTNRSKRVCYTSFLSNQFNTITSGSNFNQLVQSGVRNIKSVLIIPYISSTTNGSVNTAAVTSGVTTFSQLLSPFDTAPATSAPISLQNVQITIGGVSVLSQSPLNYSFENFIEQVSLYERLNGADLGLSNGLFNEYFWSMNRFYYVDCSRSEKADQMSPRNVVVSFTNNSLQVIDVLVFIEYWQELIINCESGIVEKE
jgi:hypothetical protein